MGEATCESGAGLSERIHEALCFRVTKKAIKHFYSAAQPLGKDCADPIYFDKLPRNQFSFAVPVGSSAVSCELFCFFLSHLLIVCFDQEKLLLPQGVMSPLAVDFGDHQSCGTEPHSDLRSELKLALAIVLAAAGPGITLSQRRNEAA